MKKLMKFVTVLLAPMVLAACAQQMVFGMPAEQWNKLSNDQQKVVIESYYKAQGGYQNNN